MDMMKNVALMAMGGAITLAYQKYNKSVMRTVKNVAKTATSKAEELTDQVDNMM